LYQFSGGLVQTFN